MPPRGSLHHWLFQSWEPRAWSKLPWCLTISQGRGWSPHSALHALQCAQRPEPEDILAMPTPLASLWWLRSSCLLWGGGGGVGCCLVISVETTVRKSGLLLLTFPWSHGTRGIQDGASLALFPDDGQPLGPALLPLRNRWRLNVHRAAFLPGVDLCPLCTMFLCLLTAASSCLDGRMGFEKAVL